MSSALAIAGVTALLRDRLNNGLIDNDITSVTGGSISVTTLPPDRVQSSGNETTCLNVFLRQVSPNLGWRNEGLPSRDAAGRTRLSNAPLALDLHYLVAAYGATELHAEILLGYALALLHEYPMLTRDEIRRSLGAVVDPSTTLPPELRALAASGLEHQAEPLRITPEYLSTEEMSKLWTATLAHYRPCAAFRVSVVLIQREAPEHAALPVLTRQIAVLPSTSLPTLESVVPAHEQPVAQLATPVELRGHRLGGTGRSVRLVNDRFGTEHVLSAPEVDDAGGEGRITFQLPLALENELPVGVYRVSARVPVGSAVRETNRLALTLAPTLTAFPPKVPREPGGSANVEIGFAPALRAGQTPRLVLGQREYAPKAFVVDPAQPPLKSLEFVIPDAPLGEHLVRLRIDGIEAPIVDREQDPPVLINQSIEFHD